MCTFGRQLYSCGIHAITGTYDRIPHSCDANKAARRAKYGFCQETAANRKDVTTTTSCPTCHPGDDLFDYDKYEREHSNNNGGGAPWGSSGSAGRAHASSSRQAASGGSSSSMRPAAPAPRQAAPRPAGRSPAPRGSSRPTHSSTSSSRTTRPAGKK